MMIVNGTTASANMTVNEFPAVKGRNVYSTLPAVDLAFNITLQYLADKFLHLQITIDFCAQRFSFCSNRDVYQRSPKLLQVMSL